MVAEWTMCPSSECPVRLMCMRNEASGVKPSERQIWFKVPPLYDGFCDHWLTREEVKGGEEDIDDVDP